MPLALSGPEGAAEGTQGITSGVKTPDCGDDVVGRFKACPNWVAPMVRPRGLRKGTALAVPQREVNDTGFSR